MSFDGLTQSQLAAALELMDSDCSGASSAVRGLMRSGIFEGPRMDEACALEDLHYRRREEAIRLRRVPRSVLDRVPSGEASTLRNWVDEGQQLLRVPAELA